MKFFFVILLVAIGFFLFVFHAPGFFREDEFSKHFERWGIVIDLPEFEFKDFFKDETRSLKKEILEAEKGSSILKITKTDVASHEKYIKDKKFLLNSLFLPTTSPYPGIITNIVECPKEFRPEETTLENGVMYTLFAGERFNYGICNKDLVKYYSIYGIFDCKEKGIFEIHAFFEEERGLESVLQSFRC